MRKVSHPELALLFFLFLGRPAAARAQEIPHEVFDTVAPALEAQAQPATGPTSPSSARTVSPKQILPNILHDEKTIFLFPVQLARGHHLIPAAAIVAATAGLVALDPHDTPYFRRTSRFSGFNTAFSGKATAIGIALVPTTAYLVGWKRRDTYAQETALFAAEAAADGEILTLVMKDVDRRLRPSDLAPNSDFSKTWFRARASLLSPASFPSGHTIGAFSVATVFANRYRKHRWVPWVAYGLAGVVGISRITLQSHFPSDVFAGAALGYTISHFVVLRQH